MVLPSSTIGKRPAPTTSEHKRSASSSLSSQSSDNEDDAPIVAPKNKRPKRAETRTCPVCGDDVPLRLLAKHALLEDERVADVIHNIGSHESIESFDCLQPTDDGPGPSTRRSALRARKSFRSNTTDTVEQASRVIQSIKRHRKQRHARLRELTRDLDEEALASGSGLPSEPGGSSLGAGQTVCPVCMSAISGDEDVLEAHIDACLAGAETAETDGVGHVGDVAGTGFHTRNPDDQDVEDDVDIDGDDQAVYGEPQFTEGDVITPLGLDEANNFEDNEHIEIDGDTGDEAYDEYKTLHDLVAEGKVVKRATMGDGVEAVRAKMNEIMGIGDTERLDLAITGARKKGDGRALIAALESKVKLLESMRVASTTSLLCRICLDPYTEPTVSTGCWHTCCRECWLRCLGSTKLCPICKRITGATDLRRIYL